MNKEQLKVEIDRFFTDKSRSASETRQQLEEIRDDIEVMIESLPESE